MKTKNLLWVALMMGATVVNAKVWRVNPNLTYDADYHTITEAVAADNVEDDDILLCEAGYYKESPKITKRLTLIGVGYGVDENGVNTISTRIDGGISLQHDSIKLEGIHLNYVTCSSNFGKYAIIERCLLEGTCVVNSYSIVRNCMISSYIEAEDYTVIVGNICNGIGYNNSSYSTTYNPVTYSDIVNNTVKTYIFADSSQIIDNIILGSAPFKGKYIGKNNTATHNILTISDPIQNYEDNYYIGATKEGLFGNSNPDITDPRQWRITSKDEFEAKTSSSTGGECGAFGGAEPFRIGMRPQGFPYLYDVHIPTAVTGDQLNINFKVGVQNE